MAGDDFEASADLVQARAYCEKRQWADALEAFLRAERAAPLERADLDLLVWSAALIGDDDAFFRALERLYQTSAEAGDARHAARAAFWIGFRLLSVGSAGRATGWLSRARRHVEGEDDDCAERGYLLLPTIYRSFGAGDDGAAETAAGEAAAIGERCHDRDLVAIARHLQGRALLRQGRVEDGLALLDEVMIAVTSGELSPMVTGIVYCSVIATCQQVYAFDRSHEWTAALARWCEEQPQLVTFTGTCLVHRSEILQLRGDWRGALEEVRQIWERTCKDEDPEVFADACYQRGELLRLRGEVGDAETAYQLASQGGRDPQPGLALLRLAQGRTEEALSAIERVVATTTARWKRARLLPAAVEIMLAAGELDRARDATAELERIARDFGTEILGAMADHARGALRLSEGDVKGAIQPLRHAFGIWHRAGAPYLAARVRVLLGTAYRSLGDTDGAELELGAARRVFEELDAGLDLAALSNRETREQAPSHGLSPRELEVLRLVAGGKTNKAIAADLCVSARTVDRHVSNILAKLEVPSRAAATAFAYRHELV